MNRRKIHPHRSLTEIDSILDQFACTPLNHSEFPACHGVSTATLYNWRKARARRASDSARQLPQLVEIKPRTDLHHSFSSAPGSSGYELSLPGQIQFSLPADFDPGRVAALVRQLHSRL